MTKHLRIDAVSEVCCPWSVIGLKSLEEALRPVGGEVNADLHFGPWSSIRSL